MSVHPPARFNRAGYSTLTPCAARPLEIAVVVGGGGSSRAADASTPPLPKSTPLDANGAHTAARRNLAAAPSAAAFAAGSTSSPAASASATRDASRTVCRSKRSPPSFPAAAVAAAAAADALLGSTADLVSANARLTAASTSLPSISALTARNGGARSIHRSTGVSRVSI